MSSRLSALGRCAVNLEEATLELGFIISVSFGRALLYSCLGPGRLGGPETA